MKKRNPDRRRPVRRRGITRAAALLALCLLLSGCGGKQAAEPVRRTVFAMDTVMNLTAYGGRGEAALDEAERELHRLDALLARGLETSAVYQLNSRGAADDETVAFLLGELLEVSEATEGAFDPTVAPVLELWGFGSGAGEHRVPSEEELAAALAELGAENIQIDGAHTALAKGAVDLGGAAKGYAGRRVTEIMSAAGVESAVIDLGGDVALLGGRPDGDPWRVAVKDPAEESRFLGVLEAKDCFVVTSGVYERFFEENGAVYHHIIDPATGCPAHSDLVSATVIAPNTDARQGVWADALATAACVMGSEKTLALLDRLNGENTENNFEMILVTGDGRVLCTAGLAGRFTPETGTGYDYEQLP